MGIEIEFDISELTKAFKKVEKNLAKNVTQALELGGQLVANEAKQNHDYDDRTSVLTNSIMADDVQGSFKGGDLSITVAAGAPYGIFVEKDTKPHIIRPKQRKALRFPTGEGFAFASEVQHPGTTGTHFLENAMESKLGKVVEMIEDATALSFEQAGFEVD